MLSFVFIDGQAAHGSNSGVCLVRAYGYLSVAADLINPLMPAFPLLLVCAKCTHRLSGRVTRMYANRAGLTQA
jgi:hypothetical protein